MSRFASFDTARTGGQTNSAYILEFWCSQDLALESAAVIIDRERECVLLVRDPLRQIYTLPRGESDDLEALVSSPLQCAQEKTGLQCARLPLPRLDKKQIIPPDKNMRNAHAIATYARSISTTSAFYVSFGTLWRPLENSKYPDGFQRITFWYSGYINSDAHQHLPASTGPALDSAEPPCMFVPIPEALERIKDVDDHAWRALTISEALWKASKTTTTTTSQQSSPA